MVADILILGQAAVIRYLGENRAAQEPARMAPSDMLKLPLTGSHLFYGDNIEILRENIPDESVDLIYLDPPFNSDANYNVLFKAPTGEQSQAQIEAFEDTWHWKAKAEEAFDQAMSSGNTNVAEMVCAMRGFLGENDMMAYLIMMAVRMIELHRVLKSTGSIFWTARSCLSVEQQA